MRDVEAHAYEADDALATLARAGGEVVLLTEDRDTAQLVRREAVLCDIHGKGTRTEGVIARWGLTPGQIPYFISQAGDSAACLPGVPGFGKVKSMGTGSSQVVTVGTGYRRISGTVCPSVNNGVAASKQIVPASDSLFLQLIP